MSSSTVTPNRQIQQPQSQPLAPPSSREALLEWGRLLVSSNRQHQPTPTGRGVTSPSAATRQQQQQQQQQQAQSGGRAGGVTNYGTPTGYPPPPNRPNTIGGMSVASQTAQIIADGGNPPVVPRQFSQIIQAGSAVSIGSGFNNNANQQTPSSASAAAAAQQQQQQQRARAQTTVVNPGTPLNQRQFAAAAAASSSVADGLLPPGQSPSASRFNSTSNSNNNNGSRPGSGRGANNNTSSSTATKEQQQQQQQRSASSDRVAAAAGGVGASAAGRSSSADSFFDDLLNGRKQGGAPSSGSAVGDTPLHRLAAMSDDALLGAVSSSNPGGLSRQSGSAAAAAPGSGRNQQPSDDGGAVSSSSGGGGGRVDAATARLQLSAASRQAVLDDHRIYINHLKDMQKSNDERFHIREKELVQILERLVDAEHGIAEAIAARTQAAAVNEAEAMRRGGGSGALTVVDANGVHVPNQRVFDGADTAALERDIEEAKREIAEWEKEEALCGAAVAQLAASIAEMEHFSSDALRIFCEGSAAVIRLGEEAVLDARAAVSFAPTSILLGETAAVNRARLHSIVAGNIDKAQVTANRLRVGLAAIERRSAAARAAAAHVGLEGLISAPSTSGGKNNATSNSVPTANEPHIHPSGVAGLEVLASLSAPSLAVNDYVAQMTDALRSAHDMQMLIVRDLREAVDECTVELRRTGATVDDAHEALQELVAQVDRARNDVADATAQEHAMLAERTDVARQIKAIETAADDQRKKVAAAQAAVAAARKEVDVLTARQQDNEARIVNFKAKEKGLEDERVHADEKLRLTQGEEQTANDVVGQLQQQTTLARGQMDAAKRRADKAADQRDDHHSELAALEQQHSTLESQIKQQRLSIRTARQTATERQKSNAEHERKVQALSMDYESALTTANSHEREAMMSSERLDKAREELRVLTMEEVDLRAHIGAVNDALMVETTRAKEKEVHVHDMQAQREQLQAAVAAAGATSDRGRSSSFVLSGPGALERPSRSGTPIPDQQQQTASRRGSVVNMVDVPVHQKRSGSTSVITTSIVESDQNSRHANQQLQQQQQQQQPITASLPTAPIAAASSYSSGLAPNTGDRSGSHNNNNNNNNNIVVSDGAKSYRMFSVSPDRAPVLVSMDTRHYGKKHFGVPENHHQNPPAAATSRTTGGGVLSQMMKDRSVRPSMAMQLAAGAGGGSARRASSPGRSMFLGPTSAASTASSHSASPDQPYYAGLHSYRPASAPSVPADSSPPGLHRREAAQALFQQQDHIAPSAAALRSVAAGVSEAPSYASSSPAAAASAQLQHPTFFQQQPQQQMNRMQLGHNSSRSGSQSQGISEVQSRLDSILKRKEQRERASAGNRIPMYPGDN